MGRCTVPMPSKILAGSVGASALGGGAQLSAPFGCWAHGGQYDRQLVTELASWMILQLMRNQMRQLIWAIVGAFDLQAASRPSRPKMEVVELWPIEPSSAQ
jgi:hypothetical protein